MFIVSVHTVQIMTTVDRLECLIDWLSMVLRLRQHNIGYTECTEFPAEKEQRKEKQYSLATTVTLSRSKLLNFKHHNKISLQPYHRS